MTEYLVLIVGFAVGTLFFYRALPHALTGYTHAFYYMWSRPIP